MTAPQLTTTTEVEISLALRSEVATRLDDYFALQSAIAALEADAAATKTDIQALFDAAGESAALDAGVLVEGKGRVKLVYSTSSRLDKKKLVSLGVTMAVIERATITTPSKPYLKVSPPGNGKDA